MKNPRYFKYALMIEQFGSFKRASLELHVSQPALSKGIAALEAEYGVILFDRDSRPLAPTEAGKVLLEEAKRIFEGEKALKSRLLQLQGMINHHVRIAFGPYAGKVYGAEFTRAFQLKFPRSELHLQTCSWEQLPTLLRNRQIDLFVGDISSEYLIEEFNVIPLPPEPLVYLCAPGHPFSDHQELTVSDFYTYPLILCSAPPWGKAWLRDFMEDFDHRESPANIRIDDYRMILDVLLENPRQGSIGSISCFRNEIDKGELIAIPFEKAPALQAGIVINKLEKQIPILADVIALLQSVGK
jgi:DNA-binding transcriptional LysR family regulator